MIVRITFVGVVRDDSGHKKGCKDYVDVHAGSVKQVRQLWSHWMVKNSGIRGASGIFHPLDGYGDIQVKSIEEVTE